MLATIACVRLFQPPDKNQESFSNKVVKRGIFIEEEKGVLYMKNDRSFYDERKFAETRKCE